MYIDDHLADAEIARRLNSDGVPSEFGRPWTTWLVHSILTNEKYLGNLVFNRGSFKLHQKAVHNPASMWVRLDAAFDPPIDATIYHRAQEERARRQARPDKAALLQKIREVQAAHGKVTTTLLTKYVNSTMPKLLARHFGTITHAYQLAGITTTSTYKYVATRRFVASVASQLHSEILDQCSKANYPVTQAETKNSGFLINHTVRVLGAVMRCRKYVGHLIRWRLDRRHFEITDFVIAVQLHTDNASIRGYYLFPSGAFRGKHLTLRQEDEAQYSQFWYAELPQVFTVGPR
jgi:hypothetical protein